MSGEEDLSGWNATCNLLKAVAFISCSAVGDLGKGIAEWCSAPPGLSKNDYRNPPSIDQRPDMVT